MTRIVRTVNIDLEVYLKAKEKGINLSQAAENGIRAVLDYKNPEMDMVKLEEEANELKVKMVQIQNKIKEHKTKKLKKKQKIVEEELKKGSKEAEIQKIVEVLKKLRDPEELVEKQSEALKRIGVEITPEELLRRIRG